MNTSQAQDKAGQGPLVGLAILSGLLSAAAFWFCLWWLALVALAPFFFALDKAEKRLRLTWFFGAANFAPLLFWVHGGLQRFAGLHPVLGIFPFVFSILVMSASVAGAVWAFQKIKLPGENLRARWANPLRLAIVWTLMEHLRLHLLAGLPLLAFHSGIGLATDLWLVQPVSIFGFSILTFTAVFVNAGLGQFFLSKNWKHALPALGLLLFHAFGGYFLLKNHEKSAAGGAEKNTLKVALLSPNVEAETKWNEATGDILVKNMLQQYQKSLAANPDLVVWPESALPWAFAADDAFLAELQKITAGRPVQNLMGMATEAGQNTVLNSAYLLQNDGKVAGRYDKCLPLALFESPLLGFQLPSPATGGMTEMAGHAAKPLPIAGGLNAGVLICNESVVPGLASDLTRGGADFLVNMSNDGWFDETYVPLQHFYNARLRAVELRRDVAVVSNRGFCGLVAASGEVRAMQRAQKPLTINVLIQKNEGSTPAGRWPLWFPIILLCTSLLLIFSTKHFSR